MIDEKISRIFQRPMKAEQATVHAIQHAAPKAAFGKPSALVKNSDMIGIDVAARTPNLLPIKLNFMPEDSLYSHRNKRLPLPICTTYPID
jgi:hypothetical protein